MRIWGRCVPLSIAAALIMVLAQCASAASAAPTGSCRQNSATPSHYDCDFYTAGNGISGGSPVVDAHGTKVGYLNGGTNFVDCQEAGSEYPSAGAAVRNDWWAWTEANNDTWGWVSALFASGGDNDGTFAGVPSCDLQRDAPPSALKSTGPAKAKPSPKPDPTSCTKSGSGTASVTFREYEQKYQQDESPGPGGLGPRYDLEKAGYHTFAGLTISADTCHGPKG